MHSAPSVIYPVGRSRFEGGLAGTVLLLGAVVCTLWLGQAHASAGLQGIVAAIWLLAAGIASYNWLRTEKGMLRWDGQDWSFESEHAVAAGRCLVSLDLQVVLLVAFRSERGWTQWLWLDRNADKLHWDDLRRALYAAADMQLSGNVPVGMGAMRA